MKITSKLIIQLLLSLVVLLSASSLLSAQGKYIEKKGKITFEASEELFEPVKASNESVTVILNTETNEIASLALMKGFRFKNSLMEEHFNENYAESDKHPKATFRGKIDGFNLEGLGASESSKSVNGSLTFHGITKEIKDIPLTMKLVDDKIVLSGSFKVLVSDFEIEIPKIVANKLSNEVEVDFNFELVKK